MSTSKTEPRYWWSLWAVCPYSGRREEYFTKVGERIREPDALRSVVRMWRQFGYKQIFPVRHKL